MKPIKALTVTTATGKTSGGRTLIGSGVGVGMTVDDGGTRADSGGRGARTRISVSRMNSVISTNSSSRKSSLVSGGLSTCERFVVVCCICWLLFCWAVVKCFFFFVFFVRMVLKHGLRGRHLR